MPRIRNILRKLDYQGTLSLAVRYNLLAWQARAFWTKALLRGYNALSESSNLNSFGQFFGL